nr:MAG TPA: hypothetical protein [Caudoviricetes sp.]
MHRCNFYNLGTDCTLLHNFITKRIPRVGARGTQIHHLRGWHT